PEKDRILIELISIADGKIGHLDLFIKLPNYINIIKCKVISKQISNIELPSNVVLCIMCRTNAILYNTENIRAIIGIDTYANVVRSVIARNEKEIVFNNLEGIVMNDEYIQANEIESIIFKDECTLNRIPYSAIKYLRNLKLIKVSPSIRWIDSMKIKNIIHIDSAGNKYIRIENKTIGITE
ncbi:MAG: hypothetical protein J6A59_17915, partial [Lachnospiraceae bacterium]|nr:hypothetical protein [Lachnospiraceae bacterium]